MSSKIKPELDAHDMMSMMRAFPTQFEKAVEWFPKDLKFPKVSGAILCGMGGSALSADIVNALWVEELRLEISREYDLPIWIKPDTLAFICSYSGNTEETIEAYRKARDKGLPVCVITKGGKVAEMAKEWGDPLLLIDETRKGFQPRFGLGYFYGYIIMALQAAGLIKADAKAHVQSIANALKSYDPSEKAKEIALSLEGKLPIVYTSGSYTDSVARIIKIKFNENSKIPAFYNAIPELNHNEMVGYTNTLGMPISVLMLRDKDEYARNAKRFEAVKELLSSLKIEWQEVWFEGDTLAERVFKMLYLSEFVTYWLALVYGYDPVPVKIVEDFKAAILR